MQEPTNAAIELHDSVVERLEPRGEGLAIHFSHAYIHRSSGEPGIDSGTGWSQRAVLLIQSAAVSGAEPALPAKISTGELSVSETRLPNVVPLPFDHAGAVKLSLVLSTGRSLVISGAGASLCLVGEPRFIEEFAGN